MIDLPCPEGDWPRFSALLDDALDLPQAARAAWLDSLAGDDASLRPSLRRVLVGTAHTVTRDLLRPPRLDEQEEGLAAGAWMGPYRLQARLGQGGMGEVWRASRGDDGPRRDVALKLPHAACLGPGFLRRFARERDVLAALSHPHIAQLYDAGTSSDGHPYLALELIEGEPITAYCRAQKCSLEQRVDLVRQMMHGLSYAHQRLIVHRDIKPGNVLVTPEGRIKLLDFGIAKLLGPEPDPEGGLTQATRLATPAYAAPEQVLGGAITVATDIFAGGVVLFELCTGELPFGRGPQTLVAQAAPLASSRADAESAGLPEGPSLARKLRGDLDAVIAKALALDPAARYPSAEAFNADLQRWREGLPVRARRIGWLTRSEKFVRRNRLGVALTAILALSLAGGTAGIAWQAQRAQTEAKRAESEARQAEQQAGRATAIKDFMIGLFYTGSPRNGGKQGDALTGRDLVNIGASRAAAAFAGDPATEFDILQALADILHEWEDDAQSLPLYAHALNIAQKTFGADDPRAIHAALELASAYAQPMQYDQMKAVLQAVRAPILQTYGKNSTFYAMWLSIHAESLRATHGARDEAMADAREAIGIFSRNSLEKGARSVSTYYVQALGILARNLLEGDQVEESLATLKKARAVQLVVEPENPIADLSYMNGLALRLERMGKLDAAEAIYAAAQYRAERNVGRHGNWFLGPLAHRITLADLRGDRARAAAVLKTPGIDMKTADGLAARTYGAMLVRDGGGAQAIPVLQAALAQARTASRQEETVRTVEGLLGEAYDQAGQPDEARTLLRAARDEWLRDGVAGTVAVGAAQERWGRFLLEQGNPHAAEAEFKAVLGQSHGAVSGPAALAAAGLARTAAAMGDMQGADADSALALKLLDSITIEYDARARIDIYATRAEALLVSGRQEEAHDLAQRALLAADTMCAPGSRQVLRARAVLARTS